jgi:predicted ATPase/class 3 adenylate cyclase
MQPAAAHSPRIRAMTESSVASVTYLFSDIEGSTRLWESDPARAARAVAWHDELSRAAVQRHRGIVVKMTGDGVHAAFDDPADALAAVIELQLALAGGDAAGTPLAVRCGLHLGADQRRDNDFYGPAVNRAARIMAAAHGGQVLLSGAVAERLAGRLPAGVVLRDLGAIRLRDLGSAEQLFQLVHPQLRTDFPPLRSMASAPNNLAQQLNSFVGRDREMGQVRQMLAYSRLLTLIGMGGLGKSRLSMQVAANVLEDYPDGVWLVELASLEDPRMVPQAVATVLGVKESAEGSLLEALVNFVADRQLLIVLDNCEHVVQACAALARTILEAGPKVQILASSRDALRIAGEAAFPVAPLPAPGQDRRATRESLIRIDSVRLFVDRARSVRPDLPLSEFDVHAVADICRRLDGIPLAIELAAARVRSMTVHQIAARLDDRFRLLDRGDRTALPRQQTLRALIDWSHDLLDGAERTLFRRLSVFAGSWRLESATSVCSGDGLEEADALNLLCNLVEKSLVMHDAATGRYRMLDTVRQYAAEQLELSPDAAVTHERHLEHFVVLAEGLRPLLFGVKQNESMERIDLEYDNMLAAQRWCNRSPRGGSAGARMLPTLKYYWLNRGLLGQGYELAQAIVERPGVDADATLHAQALLDTGTIATFIGRYDDAQMALGRTLELLRHRPDVEREIAAVQMLAEVEMARGCTDTGLNHAGAAVALARTAGRPRTLLAALVARGQLLRALDRVDEASAMYSEALEIGRRLSDDEATATATLNLAMVSIQRGALADARARLLEVVPLALTTRSLATGQALLEVCAGLAAAHCEPALAARLILAAQDQAKRSGLGRDPADQAFFQKVRDRTISQLSLLGLTWPEAVPGYREALETAIAWLEH